HTGLPRALPLYLEQATHTAAQGLDTTQGQGGRFGRHPSLAPAITSTDSHGYPQPTLLPSCEASHRYAWPPLPPSPSLAAPCLRASPVDGVCSAQNGRIMMYCISLSHTVDHLALIAGVSMHTGKGLGRVANKLTMPPCEMPETSTWRPGPPSPLCRVSR